MNDQERLAIFLDKVKSVKGLDEQRFERDIQSSFKLISNDSVGSTASSTLPAWSETG